MASFNGLGMHMGNLALLSAAESRSISPENPTGEKGRGAMAEPDPEKSPARKLGVGWKVRPYIIIQPGEVATLADIAGEPLTITTELLDYAVSVYFTIM